jgi:hypothetical protein
MNIINRFAYFFIGVSLGIVAVAFLAKKKNIQFPYGFDARTLKSIRVKEHRYFSEQAEKAILENKVDSIQLAYLLTESDVDFSKSDTDTKKPCQTYKINGQLKDMEVSFTVKRCDSSATFEEILIQKN